MKISEIFVSINGESRYSGLRTVFVRSYGCNCHCSYCDSVYTLEGDDYTEMSVREIIQEVKKFNCKRVTFTGGEPLIQEDAYQLVKCLIDQGYFVEIETNGACDISPYIGLPYQQLLITMDWKCPSSKMNSLMLKSNLKLLRSNDVLKFVVGSQEDLEEMNRISKQTLAQSYVSPVFGEIELEDIANYIIDQDNHLDNVRMQLQIHKIIWDPELRGV